jgi:hypothetical protein
MRRDAGVPGLVGCQLGFDRSEQAGFFFGTWLTDQRCIFFGARAKMQQQSGVAAVVQNHVGEAAIRPFKDAVRVIPVVGQCLALDSEYRRAGCSDGSGSVILGRVDVARSPAHFCTERDQRLDQHAGLDGHVQRAGDARALQRLRCGEFLADSHQAGHFDFGDRDFFAAPCRPG